MFVERLVEDIVAGVSYKANDNHHNHHSPPVPYNPFINWKIYSGSLPSP
jgi:hypothetical protein